MFPEVPIALRLSGHLLLGLVRIYSWKVNYLFQDCNRMLTTIRTAFASVQVDLPIDADRAPFEAITLPDTFNLDDLNLDDAIRQIDTPDNHRKTLDQITLAEGEYVMIDIDEDATVEPSASGRSSYMRPEPTEDETLPPFGIGFEASNNPNGKISLHPPLGDLTENPSYINQPNEAQYTPEKMREASLEGPELNLPELIGANNDPMEVTEDSSPFVSKLITSPAMDQTLFPGPGSLPGTSRPNVPGTTTSDPIEDDVPIHMDDPFPDMMIEPSPPQVQENKRKRPKVQGNKRKRRPKFDNEIVFSNAYLKKQIEGDELCNLVCKRRKLPQTALDMWKFNRTSQKDSFLRGPLVYGMCTNLHETHERKFPHVSDSDAESAFDKRTAGVADVGVRDASPERQLTPKSPENADAPAEHQLAQKSPGNTGAQPECHLTPKSTGNADADMAPEFPRFFPQDTPSPIRENDTPFKTPGGTLQSELGGTGATEIQAADGSYVSTIQMTHDSDPKESPFPFNDELDGDLPEIPGLISTPGVISSAGTGATGLGSMSTRTRAVAQYFKDHMPSTTSDDQPGKFSLNRILEGRARKQAARMFFETLVLKSYDYIDVQQEEAYGDIAVSVKPSLSGAKL